MKVVTFLNLKGGVGKTTSVHNIASALTRMNSPRRTRVLVIDLDHQANYTVSMGVALPNMRIERLDMANPRAQWEKEQEGGEEAEPITSIGSLLLDEAAHMFQGELPVGHFLNEWGESERLDLGAPDIIRNVSADYDFIPADPDMVLFDQAFEALGRYGDPRRLQVLRNLLHRVEQLPAEGRRKTRYDIVLIDTNPSLNYLTQNALMASSHILVPVAAEYYPALGLAQLVPRLGQAIAAGAPIQSTRALITMTRKTRMSVTAEQTIRSWCGNQVFQRTVPHATRVQTAVAARMRSVVTDAPNSEAAQTYIEVADWYAKQAG